MSLDVGKIMGMLQPIVEPHYPVPWEVAETSSNGTVVVTCAEGSYTCECPSIEVAELIVHCVNTWYKRVPQ